ncbi:hypothetical protein PT286_02745 [Neisseriaceae bacterium ESL0693]|nr:hypothetical protein [Neisseriaceae bacterium ESL0693]
MLAIVTDWRYLCINEYMLFKGKMDMIYAKKDDESFSHSVLMIKKQTADGSLSGGNA